MMEELFRSWMYSLLAAGCICSLLSFLNTDSKLKGLVETACACVMVLTFLSPFGVISDFQDISEVFLSWTTLDSEAVDYENYINSYMESEYCAYIRNEAESFGISLSDVAVTTITDENGNPIPYEIYYQSRQEISAEFKQHIAQTLGIITERQYEDEQDTME